MNVSEWLAIGQALLAPVVAVLALLVAFGQYRTARHKSQIDLFDRRFSVYKRTLEFVRLSYLEPEVSHEATSAFWSAVEEAQFLFGEDVSKALNDIKRRAVDVSVSKQMIKSTPPEKEIGYLYTMRDHQQWFSAAEGPITALFRPYLKL